MEAQEFIKLNSREVRNSPSLMAIYADFYFQVHGTKLNCNTCGFDSKLKQLQNALRSKSVQPTKELLIMEKTFQLRQVKGEILTYKNEGKTVRQYDNRMTEEFAIGFLTHGTEEQIAERKKMFKFLPKKLETVKEENATEVLTENATEVKTESKTETVKSEKPKATSRKKKTDNE